MVVVCQDDGDFCSRVAACSERHNSREETSMTTKLDPQIALIAVP
jgi:hypothetical protein